MHYVPGLADNLIKWYELNKRDLPWRHTTDPYKIWVSEIIMQQTRVQQGLPYYERFINTFPTVRDLAEAEIDLVLRLWQGLGYYSRARNMHETAKFIVEKLNGEFPGSFSELIKLKGIGRYTGAAIASFAFREKVAVVDGNVLRVLSRLSGIIEDVSLQSTVKSIESLAQSYIPAASPDIFNQAIMEFGALFCIPVKPDCSNCIFKITCFAYLENMVEKLPLKINKVKIRKRFFNYIIFKSGNETALVQRQENDIWKGLYEYYLVEKANILSQEEIFLFIKEIVKSNFDLKTGSQNFIHVLSHQRIHAKFFECILQDKADLLINLKFYPDNQIDSLPKPVLLLKNINKEIFL